MNFERGQHPSGTQFSVPKAALYPGKVGHLRTGPKRHEFHYKVGLFQLDIEQLPNLDRDHVLFRYNRPWYGYSFRDGDYFQFADDEYSSLSLHDKVRKYFRDHGADEPDRVIYMGNVRYMNHIFNPVCFFYGLTFDGRLCGVLAQVTNTYYEQKAYFIPADAAGMNALAEHKKLFYVSPFIAPDTLFKFNLPNIAPNMRLQIDAVDSTGRTILYAWFSGKMKNFSRWRLAMWYFRYPFHSFVVLVHIHYQALRLYLKRLTVFGKQESDEKTKKLKKGLQSVTG